jgi:hypothetical protein
VLTHGQLTISDTLELIGLGADQLTIDASGNDPTPDLDNGDGSRIFEIYSTSRANISGLTLIGGDSFTGGAIFSTGQLTLSDSVVSGNFALYSGGGLDLRYANAEIVRTRISYNWTKYGGGGGISARYLSTLSVADSVITGNSAGSGGGVDLRTN